MLPDDYQEQLLHDLRTRAEAYATAKGQRVFAEEYRKTVKAALMKRMEPRFPAVGAQEREAYAHADYEKHLRTLQDATAREILAFYELKEIEYAIDMWRTKSANQRAERKAYGA